VVEVAGVVVAEPVDHLEAYVRQPADRLPRGREQVVLAADDDDPTGPVGSAGGLVRPDRRRHRDHTGDRDRLP